ncbi:hypothetical protein D9758_010103 [Tetrapyrgos nigripes]|uniref:Uncharacterized protein n=1 Tax=Tetrapyrgos nigripes TaxID=182062 RepID=A0A8H5CS43_9AGAR|nr:hypothetical protein D9758_010103 [Tetrapyrgos nigripes]
MAKVPPPQRLSQTGVLLPLAVGTSSVGVSKDPGHPQPLPPNQTPKLQSHPIRRAPPERWSCIFINVLDEFEKNYLSLSHRRLKRHPLLRPRPLQMTPISPSFRHLLLLVDLQQYDIDVDARRSKPRLLYVTALLRLWLSRSRVPCSLTVKELQTTYKTTKLSIYERIYEILNLLWWYLTTDAFCIAPNLRRVILPIFPQTQDVPSDLPDEDSGLRLPFHQLTSLQINRFSPYKAHFYNTLHLLPNLQRLTLSCRYTFVLEGTITSNLTTATIVDVLQH